jgi:hypothetical protein
MTRAQRLLLGLALLCLVPAVARADISWSVNFAQSTQTISSDTGQSQVTLNIAAPVNGQNNATVVAPTMTVQSTALDGHPDTFTHRNYQYNMALTDSGSGASTVLSVSGYIQGTASQHSQNVQDVLTGVTSFPNMTLGPNIYNVNVAGGMTPAVAGSAPPVTAPAPAPAVAAGAEPPGSQSQPAQTPEPSSLVLAGLGIAGLLRWRRKR